MRKPAVDYRKLRLHNLNAPQFRHVWLLLGWAGYFLLYFLTENLIPPGNCHVIHCPLDDRIPFCEGFAVFYVGWYFLLAGSLLWFLVYDPESFKRLQTYIIAVQLMATAVYVLYPSCQRLRPEVFPRVNFLTALMGVIYAIDTPTGVFPSLHVAISLGIASTWLREKSVSRWVRGGIVWFCFMVVLSVSFVKQHSVLDILGAIPICLIAEWFAFWRKRG